MTHKSRNPPPDQNVREACLDTHQSFVVTAPAGSGKTSLLTQRTLALLATVDQPEAVLCITFTRKAAAEMRQRILSALQRGKIADPPDSPNDVKTWNMAQAVLQHDQQQQWHLLDNPTRLKITTIDGFCRAITNQLPLASGVGPGMGNIELPQQAYQQAARDTLLWLEKPNSVYHQPLKQLLLRLDGNTERLEALFHLLLLKRDQWLPLVVSHRDNRAKLERNIAQLITDQLTLCQQLVKPFSGDLLRLAQLCAENLTKDGSELAVTTFKDITEFPDTQTHSLPKWQALAELLTTATGSLRKKFDKRQGIPAGKSKAEKQLIEPLKQLAAEVLEACQATPGLSEQLALIKLLPKSDKYSNDEWQFLQYLTQLLPLLVGHLKTHFSQLSAVDFTEISQAAVEALDPDSINDILLRLDHKISHILVDEFQDTSQIQLDLLTRLTEGWQAHDGKTLFLVGDGMQSCYGFRGAEVGLFLEVKKHGLGNKTLTAYNLTTNFRSNASVVNWVNDAFRPAFPMHDDIARGAVKYNEAIAFRPDPTDAAVDEAVQCYGIIKNDDQAISNRAQEAHTVVEIVKQTKQMYPEDTIAVLVRSRNHLESINHALANAKLLPQATEIEPLARRQSIQDVIALTKAMLQPSDRLSWFAVLRAPWLALSPAEQIQVAKSLNESHLTPLEWLISIDFKPHHFSHQTFTRLSQIQQIFAAAWRIRRRKKLRVWLESLWVALNGPASLNTPSDLENLAVYWQLLDQYDHTGYIADWPGFHMAIEKLYAAPASGADPKLHVMTLHKSKGLEFDHVIIPGLDKGAKADNRELLYWQTRISYQGKPLLLMAPIDDTQHQKDQSLYGFLHEELKLKNRFESTRLLYVGCTRAIKRLHLMAEIKWDEKKNEPRTPGANTLIGRIWPTFVQQMSKVETGITAPRQDEQAYRDWHKIRRIKGNLPVEIPSTDLLKKYRGNEVADESNVPDLAKFHNVASRAFGTVLHQLLEAIALTGFEQWNPQKLEEYRATIDHWLQQLGLTDNRQRVNTVVSVIAQLFESQQAHWVLSNRHQQSECELPLLDLAQDKLYIVDRTFVDQGNRWIIDYKTSQPKENEALEDFLTKEAEHYLSQLVNYAKLLRDLDNKPVITALYFPLIDQLHIVTDDRHPTTQ